MQSYIGEQHVHHDSLYIRYTHHTTHICQPYIPSESVKRSRARFRDRFTINAAPLLRDYCYILDMCTRYVLRAFSPRSTTKDALQCVCRAVRQTFITTIIVIIIDTIAERFGASVSALLTAFTLLKARSKGKMQPCDSLGECVSRAELHWCAYKHKCFKLNYV